jgi:hypothetical protein
LPSRKAADPCWVRNLPPSGTFHPYAASAVTEKEDAVDINIVTLQPIIALLAGVLILIMPRLLNYIVAIYLIFIGLSGLLGR